jgi:hypothetical protein
MMRRLGMCAAAIVAAILAAGPLRADDFYAERMRVGEQAFSAGRLREAVDNLRVASFGLLERPRLLSECLVWLAVAQTRAGRNVDVDTTLERYRRVAGLFPSDARPSVAPAIQSEFDALASQRPHERGVTAGKDAGEPTASKR